MNSPLPLAALLAALALSAGGCSTASPIRSSAGTGAALGGAVGTIAGATSGSSSSVLTSAALGTVVGSAVGAAVGVVQAADAKKEQARVAAESESNRQTAARKKAEAEEQAVRDKEMAIANGFLITDVELEVAQERRAETAAELEALKQELARAEERYRMLNTANSDNAKMQKEILELKQVLAKLSGGGAARPLASPEGKR